MAGRCAAYAHHGKAVGITSSRDSVVRLSKGYDTEIDIAVSITFQGLDNISDTAVGEYTSEFSFPHERDRCTVHFLQENSLSRPPIVIIMDARYRTCKVSKRTVRSSFSVYTRQSPGPRNKTGEKMPRLSSIDQPTVPSPLPPPPHHHPRQS